MVAEQNKAVANTNDTASIDGVYWVPTHALPPLSTKIARLQRRAAKLGSLPITFDITGEVENREINRELKISEDEHGREVRVYSPVIREFTKVIVQGAAPKLNGWRLVARLIHPGQAGKTVGNVVNAVPGEDVPKSFRSLPSACAHCGKNWIYRKDTFVVANDAGEFTQVGSNCIADFLGHKNPEQIAAYYELLADIDRDLSADDFDGDFGDGFARGVITIATRNVLAIVAAHHRVYGWTSNAQAARNGESGPFASIGNISRALFPYSKEDRELRASLTPSEEDIALAGKAAAWAAAIDPNTDDTYLYNLHTLVGSPVVSTRTIGQVASVIGAYRRAVETENRVKYARATTSHVGTVGEKITTEVNVVSVKSFEGQFGPRHLNRFADDEGNTLVWWTGTRTFNEGDRIVIAGTVKAHNEYKGFKQTELTRVKELPSAEQTATLATLSPAAESLATFADNGHAVPISEAVVYAVPADEYAAAVAELADRGWIDEAASTWTIDEATSRTLAFAKPRKSKAAAKADKAAKAARKALLTNVSDDLRVVLNTINVGGFIPPEHVDAVKAIGFRVTHYADRNEYTLGYDYELLAEWRKANKAKA